MLDLPADVFGRLGRLFGQFFHFVRHHGKAFARFSRAGSFDGRKATLSALRSAPMLSGRDKRASGSVGELRSRSLTTGPILNE
jgi:hypothetical protein